MSAWIDESDDYLDSESEDYDSDDFDAAPSYAARRARAARGRQQIALRQARYRNAARRAQARSAGVARPAAPRAETAIRNLDLKTSVDNDELRRRIDKANSNAQKATYVTLASTAVGQVLDTFDDTVGANRWVRSGLRAAPLLLLSPTRNRSGLAGTALHPAVLGLMAVGGIAATGELVNRNRGVQIALVSDRVSLASGGGTLSAKVTDRNGHPIVTTATFKSLDTSILTVTQTGKATPKAATAGQAVVVEVTAEGKTERIYVTVDP